ncbi:MAG: hypothetical protein K2X03_29875 [Bryobacteraceae bacterium]|nr:hypothetical protein [Bryobacteraceae bacterium]
MNRRSAFAAALVAAPLMLASRATAQAKTLTHKQLADLIATAKTADDHRKLADHYRAIAAKHEMEAKQHQDLAKMYKANPTSSEVKRPGSPDTAAHCLTYAEHCRKAAKTMTDMAVMHDEMAKNAK